MRVRRKNVWMGKMAFDKNCIISNKQPKSGDHIKGKKFPVSV